MDDSWFWPVLKNYRDEAGRTLKECEEEWISRDLEAENAQNYISKELWRYSPKPSSAVVKLTQLLEAFFGKHDQFTYVEFGVCFGTTLAQVGLTFPNVHLIGFEQLEARYKVASWLVNRVAQTFPFPKSELYCCPVLNHGFSPGSVDVVYMDTNHEYPNDYEYILHFLSSGYLKKDFVFIGDDPTHTGTKTSRERFISEYSHQYKIITREDWNLWWFYPKQPG